MDTAADLVDAARRARECAIAGQALALARWIHGMIFRSPPNLPVRLAAGS